MRRGLIVIALSLGVGIMLAGGFFTGHVVTEYRLPTYQFLQDRSRELAIFVKSARGELNSLMIERYSKEFQTTFLRLQGDGVRLPVERDGSGGGMTSFGDVVLVITHEGKIIAARSADDVDETRIEPPENGFEEYVKVSEMAEYEDYDHAPVFGRFRYNDLLFFETPDERGLAVSYTEFDGDAVCYRNAIATLDIEEGVSDIDQIEASPQDWDILYRSNPCLPLKRQLRAMEPHVAGGRMVFSPPSTIYTANSDYHWDGVSGPVAVSQRPDMDYGKMVAIDLETGNAHNISSGHRNIQGITLDREGQLWAVEHGVRGGDELNRIVEGNDYGWPLETLGTSYDGTPWEKAISYGHHDTFAPPTYAWLPSVAISGMTRIEGFDDSWDGDLLMGSLNNQSLHRIRIREDRVQFVEPIEVGKRLRHVHQHSDGRLVLWTDDHFLIFLTVSDNAGFSDLVDSYFEKQDYDAAQSRKVRDALDRCMQCHSFEPQAIAGAESNAPSLGNIYEQPIASSDYRDYTDALKDKQGRWNADNLEAFLTDPPAWAPGTSMLGVKIDDPFVVTELIGLLEEVTEAND
ncbi:PQQ-dependent sugar dehydrogenase [Halomonas sp. TRM85114]|uniref:PQQ-dependent sugar dehydrogenase n=1 Tax=Halomonas jincaotanensis TaxID=2810616 RepID=UPI001BD36FCC|nr:PQQ-dependent sugar dehydrogenase [Halomonas jincaotanensis]MBS9402276.1 PQQ-dependent sugar dehydrogenase [Halomonas jincaotanensis]